MGNPVKAEFRKIFTTKMWWALLIPAVAVAFVVSLGFALVQHSGQNDLAEISGQTVHIPSALLSLGVSLIITSIFAAIYGAMAISGEFRHRTIGTTYLTGRSRGAVLAAKLSAYSGMGLLYGVTTLIFATIGALAGDGSDALPSGGSWLLVALVGIVIIMLWTLLGVGLGGLISNQIAAVVVLLAWGLAGENILGVLLRAINATSVGHYLPVSSANDSLVMFAYDRFIADLKLPSSANLSDLQNVFQAAGLPPWWVGGLVFIAYAGIFTFAGWAVSRRRDIS
jgi:ABC-type transport system involved in multi-copper enzyme maturation permease subunit